MMDTVPPAAIEVLGRRLARAVIFLMKHARQLLLEPGRWVDAAEMPAGAGNRRAESKAEPKVERRALAEGAERRRDARVAAPMLVQVGPAARLQPRSSRRKRIGSGRAAGRSWSQQIGKAVMPRHRQ